MKSRWPHPKERFLIIDIGGGSAEIILSENERIGQAFSKPLGALRLQELFLRSDPPRPTELHRLGEYIEERIGSAVRRIGAARIDRVIGTSATASAVVCAVNRIPRARRDESDRRRATTAQVRKLYRDISTLDIERAAENHGHRSAPRRNHRSRHRRAAARARGVPHARAVLLRRRRAGRHHRRSGRARRRSRAEPAVGRSASVVEKMAEHYGVPLRHARKVARLANDLFLGFQNAHRLPAHYGRLLEAAAYLHDTGHYVSDTRHHKHSYYLVANSDLPGFTLTERELIANLCRYHRKALPTPEHTNLQLLDTEVSGPSPI